MQRCIGRREDYGTLKGKKKQTCCFTVVLCYLMNHEVFLNVSIIFFLNVVFCGSFFCDTTACVI